MKPLRASPASAKRTAALAKLSMACVRLLPFWATATLASALGALAAAIDRKHARIMRRQMRLAFGESLSEREIGCLARRCYRHEALVFMELARTATIDAAWARRHIDSSQASLGKPLKESGKGVLVITGHIGNWELLAHAAAFSGYPVTALARPLKNPYLNAELERLRTRTGNKIRHKVNSISEIRRILDRGEWACFIYDQNGGPKDAFVPFFGVPAATWRSASFLHWKCQAPIAVVTLSRENWLGSRFRLNVHRVLHPIPGEDRETCERRTLAEINLAFEEAIRAHPEQWLWQHRRWKTRPPGEESRLLDGVPVFE
ncbi:MAG: Lipid A biosynthesis lauroyl acyltransferase [candidate division BRC1 bacterium ADurb.BinA364]|nr:MAG: Lipid A biosynthesis lauroyl acyltransferase [candidate division BRC1 bacterium ADurb.BinA364]